MLDRQVGKATDRTDAVPKVRGEAKYTAEYHPKGLLYAYAFCSTVACGSVESIDTSAAEKVGGVRGILTHLNAPKVPEVPPKANRFRRPIRALQTDRVEKFGQILGVAVATTFEAAREAAGRVVIQYHVAPAKLDFETAKHEARVPVAMNAQPDSQRGDFAKDWTNSNPKVDALYETPIEHHNPMEPHAVVAAWRGDFLDCYICSQGPNNNAVGLAATFSIPAKNVRVQSAYVGGGFGGKSMGWEHLAIAAMAARRFQAPVKLALTRQQMFYAVGLRQNNRQRLQLAAEQTGKLTALSHQTVTFTSTTDEYVEGTGTLSRVLYAHPHSLVTHRVCAMNLPTPASMRAPGETPGSFALESALDELAHQLGVDPVELRIVNETKVNPHDGKPWSSRKLIECLREGAARFGWEKRPTAPGQKREGNWQIGYGMASAARGAPQAESGARIRVRDTKAGVKAIVELAGVDLGTGSYTILAQTAADVLDLAPGRIKVRLGDTDFPEAVQAGGSMGAASYCSAVRRAASDLRQELARLGQCEPSRPLQELLARSKRQEFQLEARQGPSEQARQFSVFCFGANFAEVTVDSELGMVRVRRLLAVHSAGKILNPKLARSQILGGMVWGIGQALTEQSVWDQRHGNFVSRDLAHYHIPVTLDVGDLEVHFLDEDDQALNDLGVKGLGELGLVGVAAAITNAIFNATGRRIRNLPVRPSDFIE